MSNNVVILIPAFNPTVDLIELVKHLKGYLYSQIIVVNDGSSNNHKNIFDTISNDCIIINHKKNYGKGTALKTGFEYIRNHIISACAIITVDADGQHLIADIDKVKNAILSSPNNLILGCREFKKTKVPFRNKIGNAFMSFVFNLIYRTHISDTQTGLRGFPVTFIDELLTIPGSRYEYEQNMLIHFAKNKKNNISYVNITAVYNKNQTSYFKVLKDSIYIIKCLFQKNK